MSATIDSTKMPTISDVNIAVESSASNTSAFSSDQHPDAHDEEPSGDDSGADVGEPVEDVAAQRQGLAANDQHHDDHQERDGALEPGRAVLDAERVEEPRADVVGVEQHLALGDADAEAADQDERERLESGDERHRERHDRHHDREQRDAEAGVRREEDAGEARERATDAPRDRREHAGRPPQRLGRPLVVGAGGDRQPDLRVARERPEQRGEQDRDAEQDEAVLLHDDLAELATDAEPFVEVCTSLGRNWSIWWNWLSHRCRAARPWSTIRNPSVATRRTSGAVLRMKRSTAFWNNHPSSPPTSTDTGIAAPIAQPRWSTSERKQKYRENIAMPPCAKITMPEPR